LYQEGLFLYRFFFFFWFFTMCPLNLSFLKLSSNDNVVAQLRKGPPADPRFPLGTPRGTATKGGDR